MKYNRGLARGCLIVLAACYCGLVGGTSIEELQASGHLHIASTLSPPDAIVRGQQVKLSLDVSTDGWFTGGTRIDIPEIPGLIVLQTEQFASNASEIRNGQTWVSQRWTLNLFPQREGDFTLGPIPLHVQLRAGEAGTAAGELRSTSHRFRVTLPASLSQVKHWVAAPAFSVTQSFNRTLDDLAVGDAFEQEVVFEASDVLAMMLPVYVLPQQAGLAAYPSPPVLLNNTNRGQTLASRSVRNTYVAEQAGDYLLPASEYYWWNTQSAELELLSLPATQITVAGAVARSSAIGSASSSRLAVVAGGLLLVVVILRLAWVYLPQLPLAKNTARLFHWLSHRVSQWLCRLRAWRKPALAKRLNPGSSAED
jgi:hypothetical protein